MIIIQETELRLQKRDRKKSSGHFKSQSQTIPYEVTQLAFDVENETVIITLNDNKNRDSLLRALHDCKYRSGSGFKAPEFKVTAQDTNQIICVGPIDALMEFLALCESVSPKTIDACPVRPRVSVVPE